MVYIHVAWVYPHIYIYIWYKDNSWGINETKNQTQFCKLFSLPKNEGKRFFKIKVKVGKKLMFLLLGSFFEVKSLL